MSSVAAHPTGPQFTYFAEAIGALPADASRPLTEFLARITKVGTSIEFSVCKRTPKSSNSAHGRRMCELQFSLSIADIEAAAPFLSLGDSYLFFGNGSGSYSYTKAVVRTEHP